MSKKAALEALRSIKREARSMMAERMAARRAKKNQSDDIPGEEDPDDVIPSKSDMADDPDDEGDADGFGEEYPRDDRHDGTDDNDMADEVLPSIIIHSGSRSKPILPPAKRGPGRPRRG